MTIATPLPSATILLLRERAARMEVLMVVRHHEIEYASGALVFPGGKVDARDRDEAVRLRSDGCAGLDADAAALRTAAIREAFEESGVLLARSGAGADLVSGPQLEQLQTYRDRLNAGETGIGEVLEAADLRLACDLLVPFSHWITPDFLPKRFDTHFFLAEAPHGHGAAHDGRESVDAVWVNPAEALAGAQAGTWKIIFPTRMNLMKLARSKTPLEAMERAHAEPPVAIQPWLEEESDGSKVLCIPEDAGYGAVREPLERLM